MHFELLQMYRNYRNIDSVNVQLDKEKEIIVFGHFDRIRMSKMNTANDVLGYLYNTVDSMDELSYKTEMKPVILYTNENGFNIDSKQEKCVVISFMQIQKPNNISDIDKFYEYAKKQVFDELERGKCGESKYIYDEIEAHVYIPLSFMNAAVIFVANSFNDICSVLKNLTYRKIAHFQYSILCMIGSCDALKREKLSISLRFIWEYSKNQTKAVELLKDIIHNECKINDDKTNITYLMGNNDCLLTVVDEGYKLLNLIINHNNSSDSKKAIDFFSYVKNTRASIRINDINITAKDEEILSPLNVDLEQSEEAKNLLSALKNIKSNSGLIETTLKDLRYKINEFEKFINIIYRHAQNHISVPLYKSVVKPYNLFLKIATKWVEQFAASDYQLDVLDAVLNVVTDMHSCYGSIMQCQLGFFEERGFYNDLIAVASNIELAYNEYANRICNLIMCDNERNIQNITACCYVISDRSSAICATDPFEQCGRQKQFNDFLISINIPIPYMFDYEDVSCFIIHEAAHYLGCRERAKRAESISGMLVLVISNVLWQYVDFKFENLSSSDKTLLEKFKIGLNLHRIRDDIIKNIYSCIEKYVNSSMCNQLKNDDIIYMQKLMDALIETANNVLTNENFINELVSLISAYFYKVGLFFEDFHAENIDSFLGNNDLPRKISDLSTSEYNSHLIYRDLRNIFNQMLQGDSHKVEGLDSAHFIVYVQLRETIKYVCQAVNEAYGDLMMITIMNMTFNGYISFQEKWNRTLENIVKEKDNMSWLRVNFVAKYMGVDINEYIPASKASIMKYYVQSGILDMLSEYFYSLKKDFDVVKDRLREDVLLSEYIKKITKKDKNEQFKSVYNLFMLL